MNQPTDRLGQPLAVGDWVEFRDRLAEQSQWNGNRYQVTGFDSLFEIEIAYLDDGMNADLLDLTKINHKPKTTTWDQCEWIPEGVTACKTT